MVNSHAKRYWNLVLIFALALAASVLGLPIVGGHYQWDFGTYYYAAVAFTRGLNPYDLTTLGALSNQHVGLPFVYPPLTLWFFRLFLLPYDWARFLYLGVQILLLGCLVLLWQRAILAQRFDVRFIIIVATIFDGTLYDNLASGNIALLETTLVWLALAFYIHGRLRGFAVCLLAASMFKLTPILFLALLVLEWRPRRLLIATATSAALVAYLIANVALYPGLFSGYLHSLTVLDANALDNPATYLVLRAGFHTLARLGIVVPDLLQVITILGVQLGLLIVTLGAYRAQSLGQRTEVDRRRGQVFLLVLLYALLLPRYKVYSYLLQVAPAYAVLQRRHWLNPAVCFALIIGTLVQLTPLVYNGVPVPRLAVDFLGVVLFPFLLGSLCWVLTVRDSSRAAVPADTIT